MKPSQNFNTSFFIVFGMFIGGHPLSTYAKFSAYVRVCTRGLEMFVFWKILRTYLVDGP